ncbi:hypothetical protein PBNK65E_000518200 [Plasmodium berghei]|uniref:Uncharacterized protein n=1 Tax=Plasmodium berghei TaxID=5821 RepID=A0A0Y9WF90_PLABE|nr:hypothetical protein, conserved [Plasmodium berghei]CXI38885.1 hypothetical protein, conserved [Plasmodium berghei]SBW38346.1 hypothetical protein PBNK65E_000518200 [Plasmodium berghei]SCL86255.1 hypothetical protein PBSP11A_000515900 [Plasmodium berghei]SCO59217.1 hypothetical protein PBSP11RLL_000113100 [Plasmodium berghei]
MPESKIIQWKQKGENSDEDQYNNEENSENEYTDGEITETEEREDKNLIAGTNSNKSPKNVSVNNDTTRLDKTGGKISVISLIKKKLLIES